MTQKATQRPSPRFLLCFLVSSFFWADANEVPTRAGVLHPEAVKLAGGWFIMGGQGYPEYTPRRLRFCSSFCFGTSEVTVGQFRKYVQERSHQSNQQQLVQLLSQWSQNHILDDVNLPCTGITWDMARDYCDWLTVNTGETWRLPTECEWEYASRGRENRKYPWGDKYVREVYNGKGTHGQDIYPALSPVGSFPKGATPDGVLDLSGNVREWCSDNYTTWQPVQIADPLIPYIAQTVRGGSAYGSNPPLDQLTTVRLPTPPNASSSALGFRVASSPAEDSDHMDTLSRRAFYALSQVPLDAQAPPWLLMHALLALGPWTKIPTRHDPNAPLSLLEAICSNSDFLEVKHGKVTSTLAPGVHLYEDHFGQFAFIISQVNLPESSVLASNPLQRFDAVDLVGQLTADVTSYAELPWFIPAFAYYYGTSHHFINRFGQKLDLDVLSLELSKQIASNKALPCHGAHHIYAAAYLLWYDHALKVLSRDTVKALTQALERPIHDAQKQVYRYISSSRHASSSLEDIAYFGHTLEWMQMLARVSLISFDLVDKLRTPLTDALEKECIQMSGATSDPLRYSCLCHAAHGIIMHSQSQSYKLYGALNSTTK